MARRRNCPTCGRDHGNNRHNSYYNHDEEWNRKEEEWDDYLEGETTASRIISTVVGVILAMIVLYLIPIVFSCS